MKFADIEAEVNAKNLSAVFQFEDQEYFERWCTGRRYDYILLAFLIAFSHQVKSNLSEAEDV